MRILATQETDWQSRNPIIHHRLLEWLSTHGADVSVIDYDIDWASKAGPLMQRRQEFAGIHKYFSDSRILLVRPGMIRLGPIARLSWLFGNWRELRGIFRRAKPDVVVAYGISNALLTLAASRAAGRPFVYHVMDALHTHAESPPVRVVARLIESLTMRGADRVIVVSQGLARYAAGMGAPADRLTVIPIGVRRIAADPEAGARARAQLAVGEGEVLLLFVGWQYAFSGLRELVTDFARRGREVPWLRVAIVGRGDLYEELQQVRKASGLERQIIMTGQLPVDEVGPLIEAADFGLLPAHRNETMEHLVPTKVVEYMEHGKAVLATRLPGLEAEFPGLPGILYIDRPEEAIDRVRALADTADPMAIRATARRLGESCREAIQRRDDWDTVTAKFASLLRDEAERKPSA
ncbi:MAG TPA: glycosyltransferase [Verrucomicrobiae bacterium]|nr:glycosyltransferase [Verrucomicrobiae bacterium]